MNKNNLTKIMTLKGALIVGSGLLVGIASVFYWFYSQRYISTDDAYVNANVAQVAPRITGQLAHLYVTNNQFVEKGQLLFEIDRVPFEIAVDKAESQYAIDQANRQDVQISATRTTELVSKKFLSQQSEDDMVAKLTSANATVKLSEANVSEAKLKLAYTRVVAPTSGRVANLTVREGDIISANQALFAVIDNTVFWVDANFKETELGQIKPHQQARIKIDTYPHKLFMGIVESISGGSGTAFSLMPPQNATGNWVKVTQRVPVRVRLVDADLNHLFRIGTSAKVTVDLQSMNDSKATKKA